MGSQDVVRIIPDTNVLLRLVVGDVVDQKEEAVELFKKAEKKKLILVIQPVVIAEVCFVLTSEYRRTYLEVAEAMEGLLCPPWLEIEHREVLRGMWGWYREGMHFVDSYLLSLEKYEAIGIYSFDKKLNKRRSR